LGKCCWWSWFLHEFPPKFQVHLFLELVSQECVGDVVWGGCRGGSEDPSFSG
jgi:hypothetical protein